MVGSRMGSPPHMAHPEERPGLGRVMVEASRAEEAKALLESRLR